MVPLPSEPLFALLSLSTTESFLSFGFTSLVSFPPFDCTTFPPGDDTTEVL